MIPAAFLTCALALPALPWNQDKIYSRLVEMFERDFPTKTIVLIHKDEHLLNGDPTGFIYKDKWRVWVVKRAA